MARIAPGVVQPYQSGCMLGNFDVWAGLCLLVIRIIPILPVIKLNLSVGSEITEITVALRLVSDQLQLLQTLRGNSITDREKREERG